MAFRGLSYLRALSLATNSVEAMATVTLSHLPSLQALTLTVSSSTDIVNDIKPTALGGFPSLTNLECDSNSDLSPCRSAIAFLPKSTPLVSLALSAKLPSPLQTIVDIIELLPTHVDGFSLKELAITEIPEGQSVPIVEAATELVDDPFHLESLKDFHAPHSICIKVATPVSTGIRPLQMLDRLDLTTLIVGFIECPVYGQCTPKIKLQELIQVLDLFPSLTTLGLPIDATNVTSFSKRPGGGWLHYKKLALLAGSSLISRTQDVAELLSDIVPDLRISAPQGMIRQGSMRMVDNPNFAKWKQVADMAPFLTKIRMQERNTELCGLPDPEED
ncbi:hypothetical protein BKA70DRAFT_1447879 [Coprinopsis sp. MPI-PUGE-AT-0042]|nr:hypothetical protein BKA70DRAFT_1447879 [Coprinopsis sp. MPI-PUGE-AT-0042]